MQDTLTRQERRKRITGWRIYALPLPGRAGEHQTATSELSEWGPACGNAAGLGFDTLSVPIEAYDSSGTTAFRDSVQACTNTGLRLMLDAELGTLPFGSHRDAMAKRFEQLLAEEAVAGVLLRGLAHRTAQQCAAFLETMREHFPELTITVWTPGMSPSQLAAMEEFPIDGVYSSLPWWNFRDSWIIEEYERLRAIAPVIAPLADPRAPLPSGSIVQDALRRLAVATVAGEGVIVPAGYLRLAGREPLVEQIRHAGPEGKARNGPRRLTGSLSELTALFRGEAGGRLLLLNPDMKHEGSVPRGWIERRLPNGFVLNSVDTADFRLEPGAWKFVPIVSAAYIAEHGTTSGQLRRSLSNAMRNPRIAIEAVRPAVDGGAFSVKRILGETITIQADIFMDGHEELAAELLWRPVDEASWSRTAMVPLGNDVWEARIAPRELGSFVYTVRAWWDRWRSYCVQLQKKSAAGVDVSLEVEEGRRLLARYLERAGDESSPAFMQIEKALEVVGEPSDGSLRPKRRRTRSSSTPPLQPAERRDEKSFPPVGTGYVEALLDPELAKAVDEVSEHAFETQTPTLFPLSIDRNEAIFSSWYELFPRSQSSVPGQHGTLQDVIRRLPMIRRMGFDVLYFPPIHPIGRTNRKGRNNSLQAGPGDPGSPYAIGSEEGGHDALHPELGTLEDFRELVEAAHRHGMEIALDFAIQCSPDHPWLRQHPDWFNWRVDGTLKYAENPPKKYEDIVNPDFYSPLASTPRQAALWRALRDIVFFWVHQGVRIFRVDNPHTKPLPFWQWMLREVRDRYPDTLFLSEAFTRPAMMYRLGKIGFSQSYTYFTWRNTKQELTDYLTELNQAPVRDFFRPNFFVNTPDINPIFLQSSGRAGFLIRAVLAGTMSGSWGMYNGFELCVGEPVPGKEEYLDSEKYQLRQWDMDAPGNIVEEITRLNRIRRSHPALQSHLGIRFHHVDNDHILFYTRHSAEGDSIVVVVVSLDPHHRQAGTLRFPLWEWGLTDDQYVPVHDLFEDRRFRLQGASHHIVLSPERPFVLWTLVKEQGGPI